MKWDTVQIWVAVSVVCFQIWLVILKLDQIIKIMEKMAAG